MSAAARPPRWNDRASLAGFALGFAFSGFFDGILLHQVLQWHHLLSLVPGELFRSLEIQVLWDGVFHVLMWILAAAGLWSLWKARTSAGAPGAGRRLVVVFLLGFGAWNVVDVVGFHWLMGIHRIRVDVPADDRLRWDLLWLALFAGPPVAGAWALGRRGPGPGSGRATAALLSLLIVTAALISLRAPDGAQGRAVLFRPGTSAAEAFAAVGAVGGRVLWSSGDGRLVGITLPPGAAGWSLYGRGALLVGGPASPSACLSWSRA